MPYLDKDGLIHFKEKFEEQMDSTFVKTVNNQNADEHGNVRIEKVDFANNLFSDNAQSSSGTFITRTTGGDASLSDGDAWLNIIGGNCVHTGYSPRIVEMEVTPATTVSRSGTITASVNRNSFVTNFDDDATLSLTYTSDWNSNPATFGITVTGTPVYGDNITVSYTKEVIDLNVTAATRTEPDVPITATIDRSTFISYVSQSSTITLTYTSSWSADPTLYGITVTGTPIDGDVITVDYTKENISTAVTAVTVVPRDNPITATIDAEAFDDAVNQSGTTTFTYSEANSTWNLYPSDYGITIDGTPVDGDEIEVSCTKEIRGTISVFKPTQFYSTNWNLYNHELGYARTLKYHETYGFIIGGTFTRIEFSDTNDPLDTREEITPTSMGDGMYSFNVDHDGFVWVTGGDDTSTYILMTWSDWQEGPPNGFEVHSSTTIDLTDYVGEETIFPNGLMKVGSIADEIDITMNAAYKRIERTSYSLSNLITIRESGAAYDYDEDYIYYVKSSADVYPIQLDGQYFASDHGVECYVGADTPGYGQMLYGQNLKDKLRTDVVTISNQTLNATQKSQARNNIGAIGSINGLTPSSTGAVTLPTDSSPTQNSTNYVTSGGVYEEIAAINSRIGGVESPASVFIDIPFSIATSAWSSSSPYIAYVTNASITSTCGIWVFYDDSYNTYAQASISSEVYDDDGVYKVKFSTTTKPTSTISGYIRIVESVNGIMSVERGGTGASTSSAARTALGAAADNNVVHLSGTETMTGAKYFNSDVFVKNSQTSPALYFRPKFDSSVTMAYIVASQVGTTNNTHRAGHFGFYQHSPKSDGSGRTGYTESYWLPFVDTGRTDNKEYYILTGKNAVTVPQGGTGATNAANARTNLGLGSAATVSVPISPGNGGTGQTTLALARNAMGLGNTTGALPIANGGTGKTKAADALTALGAAADSDVVHNTGDENISGAKFFKGGAYAKNSQSSPSFGFRPLNLSSTMAFIYASGVATTADKYAAGQYAFRIYSPKSDGSARTDYYESFNLPVVNTGRTGSASYTIWTSKKFAIPLTVENGGTGATTAAGARTNLGLGSAATVSVPISVANGGTGKTTLALARNAMGLGNTTGALPVANGGTGATTAASARLNLGLGNASVDDVVTVAHGGTGKTTLALARNAMGLGNTTGALPIANGGTGSTTASAARTALGAQATLSIDSPTSPTGKGITAYVRRYGRVVNVLVTGTLSSDVSSGTAILTIPSGYRPIQSQEIFYACSKNWASGVVALYIESGGSLKCKVDLDSGGLYGSVTYICNES